MLPQVVSSATGFNLRESNRTAYRARLMLRITPSTSAKGAKEYFTQSLSRDDTGYYHEGQELAGAWGGKGSQMLGLSGPVSQEAYFALCDNRNPSTGEQMSPR